jgi:hypothetical protein
MLAVLQRSRAALLHVLHAQPLPQHPAARFAASSSTGAGADAADQQSQQCLYAILGVGKAADQAEVKAAFRRMAKRVHPDVLKSGRGHGHGHHSSAGGAPAAPTSQQQAAVAFLRLVEAYEVLSDPERCEETARNPLARLRPARARASSAAS